MKYLTEFRNGEIARTLAREITQITTRPWKIMEVCGGQTHSIIKNGIDQMLPSGPGASVEMIHGPGCPVCVTPLELIDKALAIAAQPGVVFCSSATCCASPGTDTTSSGRGPEAACARRLFTARRRRSGLCRHPEQLRKTRGSGCRAACSASGWSWPDSRAACSPPRPRAP